MTPAGLDWDLIIADLARHLAAASAVEQVERILGDAEKDLARLNPPREFWVRLRETHEKVVAHRRSGEALSSEVVRRLLASRCATDSAP
jgi:hypothetical protein